MRAAWEAIGWQGLNTYERTLAVSGGAVFLGTYLALRTALRALFGGLQLRRRKRAGKRASSRGKRRR